MVAARPVRRLVPPTITRSKCSKTREIESVPIRGPTNTTPTRATTIRTSTSITTLEAVASIITREAEAERGTVAADPMATDLHRITSDHGSDSGSRC